MPRGKPLSRGELAGTQHHLSRLAPLDRRPRKPLPLMSAKRRAELPRRAEVRREVLERDGTCVAAGLVLEVACASPNPDRPRLEVDEIAGRGRGGDWLDPDNCQALCQAHHDWKGAHPEQAEALGLTRKAPPVESQPKG